MKAVPCKVYSRVVGYYSEVDNWNLGKKQEFKDRVNYKAQVPSSNTALKTHTYQMNKDQVAEFVS